MEIAFLFFIHLFFVQFPKMNMAPLVDEPYIDGVCKDNENLSLKFSQHYESKVYFKWVVVHPLILAPPLNPVKWIFWSISDARGPRSIRSILKAHFIKIFCKYNILGIIYW